MSPPWEHPGRPLPSRDPFLVLLRGVPGALDAAVPGGDSADHFPPPASQRGARLWACSALGHRDPVPRRRGGGRVGTRRRLGQVWEPCITITPEQLQTLTQSRRLGDLQFGGAHPGLTLYIGNAAGLKRRDLGRFQTVLGFSLGPARALYRLFNSFVKEYNNYNVNKTKKFLLSSAPRRATA